MFCFSVQGYQGMVDGGDNIEEASWESVSSMLQVVRSRTVELLKDCVPSSKYYG